MVGPPENRDEHPRLLPSSLVSRRHLQFPPIACTGTVGKSTKPIFQLIYTHPELPKSARAKSHSQFLKSSRGGAQ